MLDEEIVEEGELFERYRIVADLKQEAIRLDKFLFDRLPNTTRNKIQEAIKGETILVNDEIIKANYKIRPNDIVTVFLDKPQRDDVVVPENIPLNIVYEDDDLLVVNKPAGMVVHPAYNNWTGTLVNALAYHFENLPNMKGNVGRPGLVHRIDKDTSGLLVVAKNEETITHLGKQFAAHNLERTYYALVWGLPKETEGTINQIIGRSQNDRRVMKVYEEGEGFGKNAITHYKLLEDFHYVSLLQCNLETGRTHQIRAHLKWLGHPLFNDATYGGDGILKGTTFTKYKQFIENAFKLMPRQALHAKTLGFIHPKTKEFMQFDSELPEDFVNVLDKWRKYSTNS